MIRCRLAEGDQFTTKIWQSILRRNLYERVGVFRYSWIIVFAALLSSSACTRVDVGRHITADDYTGSPKRIFVVNNLDASFDQQLPEGFGRAVVGTLAQCGVNSVVYRPNSMELNAEQKLAAQLGTFKPDAVLLIRQTNRYLMDGDVRSGAYLLILRDLAGKRDIWRATMGIGASASWLTDRSAMGARFADQLVRQMAADHVLKTCPPFPAEPHA